MKINRNTLYVNSEKLYPLLLGVVTSLMTFCIINNYVNICANEIDKILDSTISFTSILLGFIGVLIGILFSIKDEGLAKILFEHKSKDKLRRYFVESFVSGMLLILTSIVLYLRIYICTLNECTAYLIFDVWCGSIVYTLSCGHRIISIMIYIVFNNKSHTVNDTAPKSNIDENTKKELEEKYRREL